jgi:hypothetical protein
MEHRIHPRERVTYQVTVSYPPLGLVLGRVRDVSLGGMSIDTTPITLNLNTPVKVTIRFRENGRERLSRFSAVVVWSQDGRAGLMCRSIDQANAGAVREPEQALRRAS